MKLSPKQREALALVAAGRFFPGLTREDDGWHARWRAASVGGASDDSLDFWIDEFVRQAAMTRLSEDAEEQKHETLHDAWMMALKSRTGLVVWDAAECEAFAAELGAWSGNAAEDVAARRSVAFRFRPAESGFSVACTVGRGRRALRALGQSVYVFPPLGGLKSGPDGLSVGLSRAQAEAFVRHGARQLADAGYTVEGADISARIAAAAEISGEGEAPPAAGAPVTARLKLSVKVDGEEVTAEEIRFLLEQGSTLVFFRNRWIEVDRGILREALRALEKCERKVPAPLGFAMGIGCIGNLEIEELRSRGWLRGLVNELRQAKEADSDGARGPIPGLRGELRDYQRRGVEWLRFLTAHGFGALLADDMGLGKTVQVIAWRLQRPDAQATLVVAPLTLLSNWAHEFAKFAPGLRVYVHHGEMRHLGSGFRKAVREADVVVTSYNLLVKDHSAFAETEWSGLVLDEAQAIKNPDTQVARAVKAISPRNRIALTGTPIENGIADLWSIEEFLNPGFLGDRKGFAERFVKPIALDEHSTAGKRLRHALEPFVLRRLKSDPSIAAELGAKREIKEYCELTSLQRREYEVALADFRAGVHEQGDVFALITRLKLICDGTETDRGAFEEGGSGKLVRLFELLEQILENGESALVFSQYAKIGARLQDELEKRFGRRFPFLHGGLSARQREAEIAKFSGSSRPGVFILSLKAGGFGLNLTKATHVIHFDRWWNPAVENQATDRAHRIGQRRTVFVHAFITSGTLEEHVDEILERKSLVAGSVITEMEWLEAAKLSE